MSVHWHRTYTPEGWFSIMIAAQHVVMWSKLHYFARALNPSKTLLMDSVYLVLSDMRCVTALALSTGVCFCVFLTFAFV